MDRVILARHAESAYSNKDMMNGDPYTYVPLTRRGRKQAKALGEHLADQPLALCETSRFPRTRETADIALGDRPIPRMVLKEFDDVRLGDFEARPVEEVRTWLRLHGPVAPLPGGGESRLDSIRRYIEGYRIVLAREERVVLVVTHGLPVTIIGLALKNQEVPLTLENVQVEPAAPHPFSADELGRAVKALRAWVRQTSPT